MPPDNDISIFLRVAMSRRWKSAIGLGFQLGARGEGRSGLRLCEARVEKGGVYHGLGGFRSYGTNSGDNGNKDPYVVLGFKTYNVSDAEIKKAYIQKHKEAHVEKDPHKQKIMQQDLNNAKDDIYISPENRRNWHLKTGIPYLSNEPVRTPGRLLEIAIERERAAKEQRLKREREREAVPKRPNEKKAQYVNGHRIIYTETPQEAAYRRKEADRQREEEMLARDKAEEQQRQEKAALRKRLREERAAQERERAAEERKEIMRKEAARLAREERLRTDPEFARQEKEREQQMMEMDRKAKAARYASPRRRPPPPKPPTAAGKLEQKRKTKNSDGKIPLGKLCIILFGVGLVGFTTVVIQWEEFFY